MKSHSGTHSGTAVFDSEMANFPIIRKRGKSSNRLVMPTGEVLFP